MHIHTTDVSGGLGTPTYAAPEQLICENKMSQDISNLKPADIYPLGLIAFELFNVFTTGMERAIVITKLKETGKVPPSFQKEYPQMVRNISFVCVFAV